MTVKVGTTFFSRHGDSNAKWEVREKKGRGIWECRITDDNPEHAGTKKVFYTDQIEGSLNGTRFFDDSFKLRDAYWDSTKIGSVLHHDIGQGKWVRGVVVHVAPIGSTAGNHFKPTSLVGDWKATDLPRWMDAGFLNGGDAWCRRVDEGMLMRPAESTIFEAAAYKPSHGQAPGPDPRRLPSINIETPEPTTEQTETIILNRAFSDVLSVLSADVDRRGFTAEDHARDYRERLEKVADIIASVPQGPQPANGNMQQGPKF